MKKYFVLLTILIFASLVYFLWPSKKIEGVFAGVEILMDSQKKTFTEPLNVLIMGDSSIVFGIQPSLIPNSASVAAPGSTDVNMWLHLNKFLKTNAAPKCVLYSTAYIPFLFNFGFMDRQNSAGLYSWEEIGEVYKLSVQHNLEPLSNYNKLSFIIKFAYLKYVDVSTYTQYKIKKTFYNESEDVKEFENKINRAIKEKGYVYSKKFPEMYSWRQNYLNNRFYKSPREDFFFKQTLEILNKKNIKFIFVEMPVYTKQANQSVEDYLTKNKEHRKAMMNEFNNAKYLPNNSEFSAEHFADATHLNFEGSSALSNRVREEIKKYCY